MAKSEKKTTAGDATNASAGVTPVPATAVAAKPEAASVAIKPKWDDSVMQTAYANVCNVLGSREEIALLFGTNQAWQSGNELQVRLSHRIVLTPYTAKRLAQMLEQGVREYEQRFGEIKLS
jgi:Protein of unknown function (DUF3467)